MELFSKKNLMSVVIAGLLTVISFFILLFLSLNLGHNDLNYLFAKYEGLVLVTLFAVFCTCLVKFEKPKEK